MKKQTLFWLIAILITLGTVVYQRLTGPTYAEGASILIDGTTVTADLPRSHGGETDREVGIKVEDTAIQGILVYKRFKTGDEPDTLQMKRQGNDLIGFLPNQPPAGKLEYRVILLKGGKEFILNDTPVVIRFKGAVPAAILIPHILFIFTAQLLSVVAGLYALARLKGYRLYAVLTVIFLLVGGHVLGPVIQKYAFGAFWTGFPFGQDLTDNKVLVATVSWILALIFNYRKERPALIWIAALIFFLVNLIPHSAMGSELDYETGEVVTGFIHLF